MHARPFLPRSVRNNIMPCLKPPFELYLGKVKWKVPYTTIKHGFASALASAWLWVCVPSLAVLWSFMLSFWWSSSKSSLWWWSSWRGRWCWWWRGRWGWWWRKPADQMVVSSCARCVGGTAPPTPQLIQEYNTIPEYFQKILSIFYPFCTKYFDLFIKKSFIFSNCLPSCTVIALHFSKPLGVEKVVQCPTTTIGPALQKFTPGPWAPDTSPLIPVRTFRQASKHGWVILRQDELNIYVLVSCGSQNNIHPCS